MEIIHGIDRNNIKTSWDQITIADFFLLTAIEKSTTLSLTEKHLQILSILSGQPESEFRKWKNDDIIKFFVTDLAFLKTQVEGELKRYYFIDGKKYSLIKQLDAITAGQFIDLMTYTKDADNVLDNLHMILTVFLIPVRDLTSKQIIKNKFHSLVNRTKIGRKLSKSLNWSYFEGIPENYMETDVNITAEKLYESMLITEAMSIAVFFCDLNSLYWIYTALFLEEKAQRSLQSALTTLTKEKASPKLIAELEAAIDSRKNGPGSSTSMQ